MVEEAFLSGYYLCASSIRIPEVASAHVVILHYGQAPLTRHSAPRCISRALCNVISGMLI